ncbi:MAG: hypothetical protein Q8R15_00585 [Candidatus Micrarchaeota archaeon]|nr:hypothetical protein [Candidatus Micrarchaeota archaeon]
MMDEKQEIDKREVLAEVREMKGKNAEALAHLRELFQLADKEKKARDVENASVKTIAKELEVLRSKAQSEEKTFAAIEKALAPFKREFGSPEQLKAEIQSLEYSLQMNYSPSREKTVSKKVKQLSAELKSLATLAPKMGELSKLKREIREMQFEISTSVKKLKQHAAKSEEHHKAMLQCFKEADEIRKELPEAFHELDEKRGLLSKLYDEENAARQSQRAEFETHRNEAKANAQEKMQHVKTKAQEIMQKFKLGEPISFEELQVLQTAGIEI